MKKKVALLLSGGVDSSLSLHLLKEEGYDVEAFYLKIWLEDELHFLGDCPWEEDLSYIEKVCEMYQVPFHVLPMQQAYYEHVIADALIELRGGYTPSPDIWCNERIKFGFFVQILSEKYPDFTHIASGHYAQIEEKDGEVYLKKAKDSVKDQTYFLSRLNSDILKRLMFPIGHLLKEEVRSLAKKVNLPTGDRKDSQGICFLGKIRYRDFVRHHLGEKEGDVIDIQTGNFLGKHKGVWFYTIGQRQGLGLSGGPWFVYQRDFDRNIIYVTHELFLQEYAENQFFVPNIHWITQSFEEEKNWEIKIRHTPKLENATLEKKKDYFVVTLEEGESGIARGQSCVFYKGDYCLGSGYIETRSLEK